MVVKKCRGHSPNKKIIGYIENGAIISKVVLTRAATRLLVS